MHCLWEIIDNSVDEALGGHCDRIDVVLHADSSVEVRDNGRGIPVDIEPKTGPDRRRGRVHQAARRRQVRRRLVRARPAACTASARRVVNALSARLDVEVDRGGKTHRMTFHRGEPGVVRRPRRAEPGRPVRAVRRRLRAAPSSARSRAGAPGPACGTGPTAQIFPKTRGRSPTTSWSPAPGRRASWCPGLTITRARRARAAGHARRGRAARGDVPARRRHRRLRRLPRARPAGDRHLAPARARARSPRRCPVLDERGHMTPQEVERDVRGRRRAALGDGLRDRGAHASSTSSRRPRAAPTSPGFEQALLQDAAQGRSTRTPAGSRSRPRTPPSGSRRTTCWRA